MSRKALPAPGTYPAQRNAAIVIYVAESGALCAAIPVQLIGSDVAWSGKATVTLGKSSGELQTRTIDNLKKVFGWDGADPFTLEDMAIQEDKSVAEFEVVGEIDTYQPPEGEARDVFKIQYLNPIGGSSNMPERVADRKAVLSNWGSKFRAHSGGASAPKPSAKPAAAAKPTVAAKKAAAAGPPGRSAGSPATTAMPRSATIEEAWAAYEKANPGTDQDDLAAKFYAAQDEVCGAGVESPTPQQWGEVMTKLGV